MQNFRKVLNSERLALLLVSVLILENYTYANESLRNQLLLEKANETGWVRSQEGISVATETRKEGGLSDREIIERLGCAMRRNRHGGKEFDAIESMSMLQLSLDIITYEERSPLEIKLWGADFKKIKKAVIGHIVNATEASKNNSLKPDTSHYIITQLTENLNSLSELRQRLPQLYQAHNSFSYQNESAKSETESKLNKISRRLDALITQLQSQIELATATPSREPCSIARLIQEWYGNIPEVKIESSVSSDMQVQINGVSLKSALNNIVNNALYFAKEKQKETGIPAEVRIVIYEESGNLIIEINDNGPGIPEELLAINPDTNRQNLFDINRSLRPDGTGLGTTEAYYVFKDAGGRASIRADIDIGTTFIIILPIYRPPERIRDNSPAIESSI